LAALLTTLVFHVMHAAGTLAGIGFTMSLFIGSLSFSDAALMNEVRLGVLSGSVISAVLGFMILRSASGAEEPAAPAIAT